MDCKIVEATNVTTEGDGINYGKFMLCRFTPEEWAYRSALPENEGRPLLRSLGKSEVQMWVLDLQTGEGALFLPGGYAHADLNKHKIWVCPLFEPFLAWLYKQPDPWAVPPLVVLDPKDAPSALYGYRREGRE